MRRRRSREQGQIIPLMALLMVVLTGFAALTIDAGIDYDQSRNDHDVSDAASLAAAYYLAQSGGTFSGAYAAAQSVAKLDGCDTSGCVVPDFKVGTTWYPYLQVWTSAFSSGSTPGYYVNSSGQCSTSVTGTFTAGTCPQVSTVTDVGVPVGDTSGTYVSGLIGGKPSSVVGNAVAQTSGSAGGSGGSGISFTCEICVIGTFYSNVSASVKSAAGQIAVGGTTTLGYDDTITATGSYTVDLAGTVSDGSTMVDTGTGSQSTNGCTSSLNYQEDTISPCPYTTTAFANPLTGVNLTFTSSTTYTYDGSTYSFGAGKYCTTSTCTTWTTPSATATWSITGSAQTYYLQPGVYYGIATSAGGTVTFYLNPGVYIFDGSGLNIQGSTVTMENNPSNPGGVTLYFACGSSGSPATCTATSGAKGAEFQTSSSTLNLDLTAPTSGFDSNLLFWFDPLDSCSGDSDTYCFDLKGGTWNVASTGALYAAAGTLNITNTVSLPGPLIVGNLRITGGSNISLGGSSGLAGTTSVSQTIGPGNLAQ